MIQIAMLEDDLETNQSLADFICREDDFVLIKSFPDAESFISAFMDLNVDVVLSRVCALFTFALMNGILANGHSYWKVVLLSKENLTPIQFQQSGYFFSMKCSW